MDLKYGRDDNLEADANKLLNDSVGENKRSVDRDIEKMSYERGFLTRDQLKYYDPDNDWDTQDQPSVWLVDAQEITYILPTRRRMLMKHVGDDDDWGSAWEDAPLPRLPIGPRKTCTKCKKSKGLECFSPRADRKPGALQSRCKPCRKEVGSQRRKSIT